MDLLIAGGIALLVTCMTAPLVRRELVRHHILDTPNERSSHRNPVPRGGGIACAFGVLTGSLAALVTGHEVPWAVLLTAMGLGLVGFLDDRFQLSAVPRLIAQVLAGALLGALIGGVWWAAIGAVLVPLIVNVVNFMDGINGISALTLSVWGGTAVIAGIAYQQPSLALVGAVTAGSALGFLPWNVPGAKLFLGDVGSYLLGALAAGGILVGAAKGVPWTILVAPLSVYLVDVGVALVRRAVRRTPLMQAHREHVYQRLVDQHTLPHILVSAWTAVVALAVVVAWAAAGGWIATAATVALLGIYLASVPLWRQVRSRIRDAAALGVAVR